MAAVVDVRVKLVNRLLSTAKAYGFQEEAGTRESEAKAREAADIAAADLLQYIDLLETQGREAANKAFKKVLSLRS